jgi:hypothetical protein
MVRTLLIWLLALALPAQGVIAATMVFCGPSHHDRVAAVAAAQQADAAHWLQDSVPRTHDVTAVVQAEVSASDEAAVTDRFTPSGMQKCSVCASCCSAAAIHDTVAKLPVLEPAAADFAASASAVEPYAADGPDRPPRNILA